MFQKSLKSWIHRVFSKGCFTWPQGSIICILAICFTRVVREAEEVNRRKENSFDLYSVIWVGWILVRSSVEDSLFPRHCFCCTYHSMYYTKYVM